MKVCIRIGKGKNRRTVCGTKVKAKTKAGRKAKGRGKKRCKLGVNKRTKKCLKNKRPRKRCR